MKIFRRVCFSPERKFFMNDKRIEVDAAKAKTAFEQIPEDEPLFMLNLLRFNEQANYKNEENHQPMTGREAYFEKYAPAFWKAAEGEDVQIFFAGKVLTQFVAPDDEKWDEAAIVRYENVAAFRRITGNAIYRKEAEEHRIAALEDWRLIALSNLNFTE